MFYNLNICLFLYGNSAKGRYITYIHVENKILDKSGTISMTQLNFQTKIFTQHAIKRKPLPKLQTCNFTILVQIFV